MCQVATGAADVYFHVGMHCWDIAAAALILQEAGGVVMDTDGVCGRGTAGSGVRPLSLCVSPQGQSLT